MGGTLTQPVTEKQSDQGSGLGLRYGVSSMQGWRPEMEDAHDVKVGLRYGLDDWSFFAVFDGHAGKCAAVYAAWNLLDYILDNNQLGLDIDREKTKIGFDFLLSEEEQQNKRKELSEKGKPPDLGESSQETSEDRLPKEMDDIPFKLITKEDEKEETENKTHDLNKESTTEANSSPEANAQVKSLTTSEENESEKKATPKPKFVTLPVIEQLEMVKNAIKSGFLEIDESMRVAARDMSGSTAVCALVSPTHIFIANCGDSRAVFHNRREPKKVYFATEDHKPLNPKERLRIVAAGGTVSQRINGTLAVSRALGDFEYKKNAMRGPCEQLVSPEPEVYIFERHPQDEFLILACDGIWDVMTNEDLIEFVGYKLKVEENLETVCSSVLDLCLHRGSRDNMSIIIVVFEDGPKVDPKEVELEKMNNEILLRYADSLQDKHDAEFSSFLDYLNNKIEVNSLDILPPGGGIEAKYDLLFERFEKNQEVLREKKE